MDRSPQAGAAPPRRSRSRALVAFVLTAVVASAATHFGVRYVIALWQSEGASLFAEVLSAAPSAIAEAPSPAADKKRDFEQRLARWQAETKAKMSGPQRPERIEPGSGRRLERKVSAPPSEMQAARERVQVTVYYTQGCRYCTAARRFLKQEGIRFQGHDVEADPRALSRQRALNPRGSVPTIDVDGEVLVGFNAQLIARAIDRAAQRRLQRL